MTASSKRHVRALERFSRSEGHPPGSAAWECALAGIAAYEEELLADIGSDELVQRALKAEDGTLGIGDFGDTYFRECWPDLMRAVLRIVVDD